MKNTLFFLVAVLFIGQIYSQEIEKPKKKFAQDTTYIKSLTDKLLLKLLIDTQFDTYSVTQNDTIYKLYPNIQSKFSVGLAYRFLIFKISIPQSWYSSGKEDKRGNTEIFVLEMGLFYKKWYQYFYYSNTKGYYVENSQELNPSYKEEDIYLTFPNLRHKIFESTTYYIVNSEKFSYRSFLHQNEIQKKGAGSFIPVFKFSYLVREDYRETEKGAYQFTSDIYSISAMLGYQHNWVPIKKINISAGIYSGGGVRKSRYDYGTAGEVDFTKPLFISSTNLGVNYYYKNIFGGVRLTVNANSSKGFENSSISNVSNYTVIFLGYKFNPPKLVEKGYHKIFKPAKK